MMLQLLHPHALIMLRLQELQKIYGKINTQHGFIFFFLLHVLLTHQPIPGTKGHSSHVNANFFTK